MPEGRRYEYPSNYRISLPTQPFLYTVDQIADILRMPVATLKSRFLWIPEQQAGIQPKNMLLARNISPDKKTEYRVTHAEFIRFLRQAGFKYNYPKFS